MAESIEGRAFHRERASHSFRSDFFNRPYTTSQQSAHVGSVWKVTMTNIHMLHCVDGPLLRLRT